MREGSCLLASLGRMENAGSHARHLQQHLPHPTHPVDFGSSRAAGWRLSRRSGICGSWPGKHSAGELPRVQRRGFYYYDVYSFPGSVSRCQGRRGQELLSPVFCSGLAVPGYFAKQVAPGSCAAAGSPIDRWRRCWGHASRNPAGKRPGGGRGRVYEWLCQVKPLQQGKPARGSLHECPAFPSPDEFPGGLEETFELAPGHGGSEAWG